MYKFDNEDSKLVAIFCLIFGLSMIVYVYLTKEDGRFYEPNGKSQRRIDIYP